MTIVLDASALMALLLNEPGSENLSIDVMRDAVVSSVNIAEVQGNLVRKGAKPEVAWEDARRHISTVEPFAAAHAKLAGSLIAQTRPLGLSLGDRACLALAISLNAPVYTADRAWKGLKVSCRIHLIR